MSRLKEYLRDPFLKRLYTDIREAGGLKSILIDITHKCNIRCVGCYFFSEDMNQYKSPEDEADFDAFIEREKARGTNFVTIVGGEPSLKMDRVKKIYDNFWVAVATNGTLRFPYEGFEDLTLGISVWGDHETDTAMRGSGKLDVFGKSLGNYKDDPRAMFYYTVAQGMAHEVESVTERIVNNGNRMIFSYYGDISRQGGVLDHTRHFDEVYREINRMIERYPDRILTSSYINQVISSGTLYGKKWGYDTCTSVTANHPRNADRIKNGNPYNPHFRAYYPDLTTTRRCCVGEARDCSNCFDTWAHMARIVLNMKPHLESKHEFTNWLTTLYIWYLMNRVVNFEDGIKLLPEIHERQRYLREAEPAMMNTGLDNNDHTARL